MEPAAGPEIPIGAAEIRAMLTRLASVVELVGVSLTPICHRTLPATVATLRALIKATETAALRVLDEVERLQRDSRSAADDREQSLMKIVDAMEFQDLTGQHLTSAVDALEETRVVLGALLRLLGIPPSSDEPPPIKLNSRLSAPGVPSPFRQHLADQLVSDVRNVSGR